MRSRNGRIVVLVIVLAVIIAGIVLISVVLLKPDKPKETTKKKETKTAEQTKEIEENKQPDFDVVEYAVWNFVNNYMSMSFLSTNDYDQSIRRNTTDSLYPVLASSVVTEKMTTAPPGMEKQLELHNKILEEMLIPGAATDPANRVVTFKAQQKDKETWTVEVKTLMKNQLGQPKAYDKVFSVKVNQQGRVESFEETSSQTIDPNWYTDVGDEEE